jgi:hypothetical protein
MNRPCQILCFLEDVAHEKFLVALIRRAADQVKVPVRIQVRNATGGSRAWTEFRRFLADLGRSNAERPDILVVAIDGNCRKSATVRDQIKREACNASASVPRIVCAVPDPHIERWYIEDSTALPQVLPGAQSRKLRYKCQRHRYKGALRDAVRLSGVEPMLGGAEYGEDVAQVVNPEKMDRSFRLFWRELLNSLKDCQRVYEKPT